MFSDRQIEILTASVEIIASKGIQGLTIKNLSKEIGISEAAIYRHFDSKTNILLAILKSFEQESINFFKTDSEMNPKEKIVDFFSKMLTVFQQRPSIVAVIFSEEIFQNDEKLTGLVNTIMKNNQEYIDNIIKEGQTNKLFRDDISSEYLTFYISGAMRLLVKDWRNNKSKDNLLLRGEDLLINFFDLIKQ
ncbi:MAG: TetR/AcrR family transcriptional regulator [Bacteroidetes bacterium]|nr:TetR/AcrR family transcriptional regulator [Bacteroidota bacterium]